jgi:pyruvate dehydrogenase E2 component (dihydrolipoamide acetyltransferase)
MAVPVIMPRQGQSVETCFITGWYKSKGDKVNKGDILFSYETDKAAFDQEANEDGILLDVFFAEGDEVPVLETVAVIGSPGDDYASLVPGGKSTAPGNEPSDSFEEQFRIRTCHEGCSKRNCNRQQPASLHRRILLRNIKR